jgi:hypothetical protein
MIHDQDPVECDKRLPNERYGRLLGQQIGLRRVLGKAVQPGMAAQLLHVQEGWEEEL